MMIAQDTIKQLPKADLHRHIEATVRLSTAREVAEHHNLDLPWRDEEAFRQCLQYTPGVNTFFSCFHKELWVTEEVIRRVATEAVEDAVADNLVYLELRFSTDHYRKHYDHDPHQVVDILSDVASQAPIPVRLIMAISGGKQQTWEYVSPDLEILRDHARRADTPLVGVDLCRGWFTNDDLFQRVVKECRAIGSFPLTVHAGEGRGSGGMIHAIDELGADRIGHGVGCWFDRNVLDLVMSKGIPLEVCPTSNVHTGAIAPLSDNPAAALLRHGVKVTLNTDDPSISGDLTMSDEYANTHEILGLSVDELKQTLCNSIEAAFISNDEKLTLWARASAQWDGVINQDKTEQSPARLQNEPRGCVSS